MSEVAAVLHRALVASYRPYVRRRLAEQGISLPEEMDAALAEGEAWLGEQLEELLRLPFHQQRRGPLEVFQQAMSFPTAALTAAGATPPRRDPVAVNALPGDRFDLAPASSRDLGEEVWRAHIAWGMAKARQVGGKTS